MRQTDSQTSGDVAHQPDVALDEVTSSLLVVVLTESAPVGPEIRRFLGAVHARSPVLV